MLIPGEAIFLGDAASLELAGADWVDHPEEVVKFHDALKELDFEEAFESHFEHMPKQNVLDELRARFPKKGQ